MRVIERINPELLGYLDEFKDWVFSEKTQLSLESKIKWPKNIYREPNMALDFACSEELLSSIDHERHIGYPLDLYGVDLNYAVLQSGQTRVEGDFLEEIRRVNLQTDEKLQNYLGARKPALKAFYPSQGYIAWHTNWNAPGYNVIFTYSKNGKGYWRHIDPAAATSCSPEINKLVQINDSPGWHCKVGYFGAKHEHDKAVWHSAYTNEPRVTVAYVISDQALWESMADEIGAS